MPPCSAPNASFKQTVFMKLLSQLITQTLFYDAENYSKGQSANDPNLSEFVLSILKRHMRTIYLHNVSNMFRKFERIPLNIE